jgi:predicted dehydrogenase
MRKTPDFYIPFLREIQHFVYCVKEDILPSPSGEDALRDLEIIAQAYKNKIHLD